MDASDRYYARARDEILHAVEAGAESLLLAGRGLRELPPEVGMLRTLKKLDVRSNYLTRLPEEIGNLGQLEELIVCVNKLTVLPDSIGRLSRLQHLDLEINELRSLPRSFTRLESADLVTLKLGHNPFDDPIPSLLRSGMSSVFSYLRSLEDGEAQYEAKLLLVGEGEVGKTSLLAALRDEPFLEGRSTTHGIEIRVLKIPHPREPGVEITLNAWDFGGQEVYRITHQFFFSRRSLYLVVWNPRQGHEANEVEEWVKRIRLRVGDEARVLVVATHADIRRPELDFRALQAKYPLMVVEECEIDSKSGLGLPGLRSVLAREASLLPQMGELLSRKWASARQEVLKSPETQIALHEFERLSSRNGLDGEEVVALAGLLHDLGHVVHYADDEGLRDLVVLQPEWLTKAIGFVLEDRFTRESGGVLSHNRLREIWQGPGRSYPEKYFPYFLRLMEKFDVSYRLPDSQSSLIAQLVPYERPNLPSSWSLPPSLETERRLTLICTMEEEAPGLVSWLTVRNSRFSTNLHWRRGVFLRYEKYASEALIDHPNDKTLVLEVRAPSPDHFFSILRDSIEELIAARWPGLSYDFLIPCPGGQESSTCAGRFALRTLQKYREKRRASIECAECLECHDVTLLLTGFDMLRGPLQESLESLRESQLRVEAGLQRVEAYAADAASQARAILRAIASESGDCPRMFTLEPVRKFSPANLWRQSMDLTLWCEHPGSEHSWREATYRIKREHDWLAKIAPYALLIAKTLRLVVPLASTAIGDLLDERDADRIARHLELMNEFAGQVIEAGVPSTPSGGSGSLQISVAEGAALRALVMLLTEEDPDRSWGGLRRKLTPSGDYVWVCRDHYHLYDPGLPELPPQV